MIASASTVRKLSRCRRDVECCSETGGIGLVMAARIEGDERPRSGFHAIAYYLGMRRRWLSQNLKWVAIGLCPALMSRPIRAQTDEIQVYTGGLEAPRKFNLTIHANYTPGALTIPRFPGG